ncbi:hypothetical protein B0H13DRAFT_2357681 [Mycena leptocephala]|nr:hypothetical protein B0H13DRAFT_2357681 [Mycena leptocephala]
MSLSKALPDDGLDYPLILDARGHFVQTESHMLAASLPTSSGLRRTEKAALAAELQARAINTQCVAARYTAQKARQLHTAARDFRAMADDLMSDSSVSQARTCIRRCAPGVRASRDSPLTREALWLNDEWPPTAEQVQPDDQCGLCLSLKSRPVSYKCGHSHCYVCIRVWLEQSWECPDMFCGLTLHSEPIKAVEEELRVAARYPDCVDNTSVDYSWKGLVFPKRLPRAGPVVESDDVLIL